MAQGIKKYFLILFVFLTHFSFGQDSDLAFENRAKFILETIDNVGLHDQNTELRIGIYGKGKFYRNLEEATRSAIESDPSFSKLSVERFRRIKSVKDVDIMYLHGDSEISLSKLEQQIDDTTVLIITENFPFGTSAINFSVDENNEVFYEVNTELLIQRGANFQTTFTESNKRIRDNHAWKDRLEIALQLIDEQEQTIQSQDDEIHLQDEKIEGQENTISENEEEIKSQDELIAYQKAVIIIGTISLLIILGLIIFLYRTRKQKTLALKVVEEKNAEIIASITYAERIQKAVLPKKVLIEKTLQDHFVIFKPKDIIGGDFYWMQEEDDKVFFAVADCTGHGVPGAMLSVMFSNWLTKIVKELKISDPGEILTSCVEILKLRLAMSDAEVRDGMDISLCAFDRKTRELTFAGANNPLFIISDNEVNSIKADRQPIGNYEEVKSFRTSKVNYKVNDVIYLLSDGYSDQFGGPKDKKFTKKRLKELFIEINSMPMDEQKSVMMKRLLQWQGELEQIDDICVMGIKL